MPVISPESAKVTNHRLGFNSTEGQHLSAHEPSVPREDIIPFFARCLQHCGPEVALFSYLVEKHNVPEIGKAKSHYCLHLIAQASLLCASFAEQIRPLMRNIKIDNSICNTFEAQGAKRTAAQARQCSFGTSCTRLCLRLVI